MSLLKSSQETLTFYLMKEVNGMFAIIATMDITGMRKNYSVRHVVLITVQLANQF